MTDSPAILLAAGGPKTRPRGGRVLAPTRYRHPGDVIRLIAATLVLAVAAVIAALLPALLRPGAAAITGVRPATAAGQVLTGVVNDGTAQQSVSQVKDHASDAASQAAAHAKSSTEGIPPGTT